MQNSLFVGLEALRANPLRTLLSALGVVMGVGAMVSVLALGDGVEKYARDQISQTTDLLTVIVSPRTNIDVDGQLLRRETVLRFTAADARELARSLPAADAVTLAAAGGAIVTIEPGAAPRGFQVRALEADGWPGGVPQLIAGRWFVDADTAVVVLSNRAAGVVAGDSTQPALALGRRVALSGNEHTVIGVMAATEREIGLVAAMPVADGARALTSRFAPQIVVTAKRIEDIDTHRDSAESWASRRFGPQWKDDVQIVNRRDRAEQAAQAMRIFKLLMAAITGVSLLVGGVGIMNVLLASVAERTREIGIRKAAGATHRDVLVQFLTESVAITSAGAFVGVLLGLAIAFGVAAVMRAQTAAPVHAAVTLPTVAFAVVVSVAIGLAFGLYPARRAASLSPIDAIRHET